MRLRLAPPAATGQTEGAIIGTRGITALLWALAVFDLALTWTAWVDPGRWFVLLHGVPAPLDGSADGFLPRTGASWFMFAVLECAAALRWRQGGHWLAAIAAVRASDCLTDVTYAVATPLPLLPAAGIALIGASAVNVWLTWYLLQRHTAPRLRPPREESTE
ncbi:hypothetical protein [Streptomyces sp. NPDC002952]|uniref:hypothetical protein n=1 Tax=Streptomyces sp. NPDC002952 TaxID=3364673 RepID=UPI0036AB28D9